MKTAVILLIDDDDELRESTAYLLRERFHVICASNLDSSIKLFRNNKVDCILLDLCIHDISGTDFLRIIRDEGSTVPVIAVTGKSCLQYAEECADLGVSGYLKKPFDIDELIIKIDKVLGTADIKGNAPVNGVRRGDIHPKVVEILNYVDENYWRSLSIGNISREIGISYGHLSCLFKESFGITFVSYLNRLRVEKAKDLIRNNDLPLKQIRENVGFATEQHFFKQFKKHAGLTPACFKKNI